MNESESERQEFDEQVSDYRDSIRALSEYLILTNRGDLDHLFSDARESLSQEGGYLQQHQIHALADQLETALNAVQMIAETQPETYPTRDVAMLANVRSERRQAALEEARAELKDDESPNGGDGSQN